MNSFNQKSRCCAAEDVVVMVVGTEGDIMI